LSTLLLPDFTLLSPHLRDRDFKQGTILQEAGDAVEQVYFPQSGMISMLAVMQDGNGIEAATIGREGAVGIMAALGSRTAPARAVVQVEGRTSQISVPRFRTALEESAGIRDLVVRYNDSQMALILQSTGCNALHDVERRLCRWLLQTRDRCESDVIPLTHEFVSEMLGVQRSTVTLIARELQSKGLIRYRRGRIEIVAREGLEKKACECYDASRRTNEGVFSPRSDN
jgi:CRP-like cAMP-binding protein